MRRIFKALLLLAAVPLLLSVAYNVIPPVSTLMIGRWVTLQPVERRLVRLGDVSPSVPVAVLTAEDAKFCAHGGIDWDALQDIVEAALEEEGEPVRGASTLTQQTVKNLFLWNGRSYIRKGLEIPLALWFDLVVPKRRQLEIYLNVAEWGDGVFGIEAAARKHFGKGARVLSAREAASLASALPSPRTRDPARPGGSHRLLFQRVLTRMGSQALDTSCLRT
ncbi:MAG: monofunctional biosynthetic peptidoglycan transglycosylase [Beijerinckiaceae bacterium]